MEIYDKDGNSLGEFIGVKKLETFDIEEAYIKGFIDFNYIIIFIKDKSVNLALLSFMFSTYDFC